VRGVSRFSPCSRSWEAGSRLTSSDIFHVPMGGKLRDSICRVTGDYKSGHSRVDLDDGTDGLLRVRLAFDPGCDGVVDAEDVDFLSKE
jgi:hypothetical protein